MSTALVILAAGISKRFGTDKRLHLVDGEPMLLRCLRLYDTPTLRKRLESRIVVLSGETEDFCHAAKQLGYRVVYNEAPERGIASSIRLGTEAAKETEPIGVLYSVADQPYLTERTVLRVLDAFEREQSRIVAPIANGKRGNPVVFPNEFLCDLERLEGDCGGSAVIRKHANRLLVVETEPKELEDIDWKTEETR